MKKIGYGLLAILLLGVGGCGMTKKSLGLSRQGPDETLVTTNQPLVLPPEYSVRPQKTLLNNTEDDAED